MYASSTTIIPLNSFNIFIISLLSKQLPVGLFGEHKNIALVSLLTFFNKLSESKLNLSLRFSDIISTAFLLAHPI